VKIKKGRDTGNSCGLHFDDERKDWCKDGDNGTWPAKEDAEKELSKEWECPSCAEGIFDCECCGEACGHGRTDGKCKVPVDGGRRRKLNLQSQLALARHMMTGEKCRRKMTFPSTCEAPAVCFPGWRVWILTRGAYNVPWAQTSWRRDPNKRGLARLEI
jgi:hypothetical protein